MMTKKSMKIGSKIEKIGIVIGSEMGSGHKMGVKKWGHQKMGSGLTF